MREKEEEKADVPHLRGLLFFYFYLKIVTNTSTKAFFLETGEVVAPVQAQVARPVCPFTRVRLRGTRVARCFANAKICGHMTHERNCQLRRQEDRASTVEERELSSSSRAERERCLPSWVVSGVPSNLPQIGRGFLCFNPIAGDERRTP